MRRTVLLLLLKPACSENPLRESLQQAVAEGDGAGLEGAQEHGSAYRTQVRNSGTFGYLDGSLTSGKFAKFLRS